MSSPATALVHIALQNWARCCVKADNISVVVVLFENCKSLDSTAFQHNCNFEEDVLALPRYSMSSISDTPVRNHRSKNLRARKPLSSISNTQNNKCGSAKRRKHRFKIPTTPEQRSVYWSRRKYSKMVENLPLDFVNENPKHTHCRVDSFAC